MIKYKSKREIRLSFDAGCDDLLAFTSKSDLVE